LTVLFVSDQYCRVYYISG